MYYQLIIGSLNPGSTNHPTSRLRVFDEVKLAYFVWLLHANFRGAAAMWANMVQPVLLRHEASIDAYFVRARVAVSSSLRDVCQRGLGLISGNSILAISHVRHVVHSFILLLVCARN